MISWNLFEVLLLQDIKKHKENFLLVTGRLKNKDLNIPKLLFDPDPIPYEEWKKRIKKTQKK